MKCTICALILILGHFNDEMVSGSCDRRLKYKSNWENTNSNKMFPRQIRSFTFNLLRTLVKDSSENVFFYPLNIVKHLFAMFWGADRDVARQIEHVLDLYLSTRECHKELHNYFYDWHTSAKTVVYKAIDRIYLNSSVKVFKTYMRHIKMYYPHIIQRMKFSDMAQNELLDFDVKNSTGYFSTITKDMLLVLLSVVYGKINLNLKLTQEPSNNSTSVTTLVNYRKDDDAECHLVELPIRYEPISLLLVLPSAQHENITVFMDTVRIATLHSWMDFVDFQKTHVSLPKINLNLQSSLNLENILPKLGITKLFKKRGGLSKMSYRKDLLVDRFIQRAFLSIKTHLHGKGSYLCGDTVDLNTTMPYLLFVIDKQSKMIISASAIIKQ